MAIDVIALKSAKKYTDDSMEGAGAVAGKPCQIKSITEIEGGHRVTYLWLDNSGEEHTDTMDVMDGAKGDKGDKGNVGEKGATGEKGETSTIQVGTVTSGESPSVTNVGTNTDAVFNFVLAKGDRGEQGLPGEDGQDGKSFDIKAQFPNYAALIAAHPTGEAGDAYFVGTDENPDLYIWLTDDNEWFNNGKIAGVKGDKGDTGESGFSPVASVSKVGKVATITIRDKTGQTTATVSDGEDGEDAQYETLPTASATNEGMICQYIGETSGSLVNGHFYQCVNQSGTFVWVEKFGSAIDKDANGLVRPSESRLVDGNAVYSAINNALSSVYTARGDISVAELTSSLLIEANVGNVYELSDSGVTTDLFLQGAGVPLAVGDNVGIIQAGANTYLFNKMAGAFDLTDYQTKDLSSAITIGGVSQTTVEGALGGLNGLVPSGASASNKLVESSRVNGATRLTNEDLNELLEVGTYFTLNADTVSHKPVDDMYNNIIEVSAIGSVGNDKYFMQTFSSRNAQLTYFRHYYGGNWTAWRQFLSSNTLTSSVTENSTAPITSGGVYSALISAKHKAPKYINGSSLLYWVQNLTWDIGSFCGQACAGQAGYPTDGVSGWRTYLGFRNSDASDTNIWTIICIPNENSTDTNIYMCTVNNSTASITWKQIK